MNSKLKKMVEAAVISGTLVAAIVSAQAQSASTGHTAVVSGAGAKGAYADQVNVSAEDGNLTISGGAAGGVRVGDTKIQIGIEGAASAPLPTPSKPVSCADPRTGSRGDRRTDRRARQCSPRSSWPLTTTLSPTSALKPHLWVIKP